MAEKTETNEELKTSAKKTTGQKRGRPASKKTTKKSTAKAVTKTTATKTPTKATTGKKHGRPAKKADNRDTKTATVTKEKKTEEVVVTAEPVTTVTAKPETKNNTVKYWLVVGIVILIGALCWWSWHQKSAETTSEAIPSVQPVAKSETTPIERPVTATEYPDPRPGSVGELPIDTYIATQMSEGGEDYDLAMLIAIIKMAGEENTQLTVTVNGDGTAKMNIFGQEEDLTYDETAFYTRDMVPSHYTWDGGQLVVEEENSRMVFVPHADYVEPELDEETMAAFEAMMNDQAQ